MALMPKRIPGTKVLWRGAFCGCVSAAAIWLLSHWGFVQAIEHWLADRNFAWRGPRATETKVVLIGLDEASLDQLGTPANQISPKLAEIVCFVKSQGAAAIGLDLIVPENLSGQVELQPGRSGDASKLGHAIVEARNVVLSKWFVDDRWLEPLLQWRYKQFLDQTLTEELIQNLLQVMPELRARKEDFLPFDVGFVNLTEDNDQCVRRQLLFQEGDDSHTHFALALCAAASQRPVEWRDWGLWLGEEHVPL